jgi:hypothetical protein
LILKEIRAMPYFRAKPEKPYGSSTLEKLFRLAHKVIHRSWGLFFASGAD